MRKLLLASTMLAFGVASAPAADLGSMPYAKAPSLAPVYSWTGFYLGANGGGGIASSDHNDPDCNVCASTKFQVGFGTVGVGAGYNYQFGHSVVGIEGDYNWASVDKTKLYALGENFRSATTQFRMHEFATVRARGGLALDRTFIYVTAGAAFAHVENTTLIGGATIPANIVEIASEGKWKLGLAAGAGVEFAVTQNWTVKGEYLFMKFEDSEASVVDLVSGTPTCNFNRNCRMNYSESVQTARLGLNYRFGY
jgi:outer membrane immunogenic protein